MIGAHRHAAPLQVKDRRSRSCSSLTRAFTFCQGHPFGTRSEVFGRVTSLFRRAFAPAGAPAETVPSKDVLTISYAPEPDGDADPGEVVWTWVPYEDDPGQGKDRPVLVIGTLGRDLAVLPLTSKDHNEPRGLHRARDRRLGLVAPRELREAGPGAPRTARQGPPGGSGARTAPLRPRRGEPPGVPRRLIDRGGADLRPGAPRRAAP